MKEAEKRIKETQSECYAHHQRRYTNATRLSQQSFHCKSFSVRIVLRRRQQKKTKFFTTDEFENIINQKKFICAEKGRKNSDNEQISTEKHIQSSFETRRASSVIFSSFRFNNLSFIIIAVNKISVVSVTFVVLYAFTLKYWQKPNIRAVLGLFVVFLILFFVHCVGFWNQNRVLRNYIDSYTSSSELQCRNECGKLNVLWRTCSNKFTVTIL